MSSWTRWGVNSQHSNLADWVNYIRKGYWIIPEGLSGAGDFVKMNEEDIVLANVDAKKFSGKIESQNGQTEAAFVLIVFQKDEIIYEIEAHILYSEENIYTSVLNKMLSTFKFFESEKDIEKYLHPNAILRGVTMPPEAEYQAISVEKAMLFAIQYLEKKGIKEIQICETGWMIAPIGGFLIDGKGDFSVGEKHYSIFRIGVRDGSEGNAGEKFVFIARGDDGKGGAIWYPEPGPDFNPTEGEIFPEELLSYEFLSDREKFESLSSRFK